MKELKKILVFVLFIGISMPGLNAQNYKLPTYTKFQLDNGLTVYLMEQHDVPLISVSAVLPAGAIYDDSKSGLAQLTALALKHGTQNYSKAELDEALDFIGANIGVYASKEYASLSSRFASKDKELVMNLIKELLRNPIFDEEEFNKEKSRLLIGLERDKESPRAVIGDYFERQLFGDHVYGNAIGGKQATVENLSLNDVKAFYAAHYTPNNSAITIVGDFKSNDMKQMVTALFSEWKARSSAAADLASQPLIKPTSGHVLLVNKDDAKETTFYIGAPGVARNNKDFIAIQVINTLFGGRFTSMLNEALRTNSGLTYGARSRFTTYKYGGTFYISTFTAKETTEQAVDMALEVLHRLHTNGIDEKSLASAKNYVQGQFPPRYETVGQLSDLLSEMFWYDFDESFINDFEKNVDELTLDRSKQIIANYFPEENLQFVLVGKASDILTIAEKYGPVKEVDIKD
jgi:predicted Zn-dependent peptidase